MKNSRRIVPLLALLLLGLAPFGFGQLGSQPRTSHRSLGYYDPATGAFEPLHPDVDLEATPVTPTTGTLVFKFTITVDSTIPKNGVVGCSADASVSDASGFSANEQGEAVGTHVSGNTYSCTVTIHYSWLLTSPTTDKVFLDWSSSLLYGYQVTASNGTSTVVQPVDERTSSQPLSTLPKVPANGATTTETINITL
jgi:hypothetical protein